MEQFGLRVASLNRFVSAADRKETLAGIRSGDVDVVIGTHRLLSKDVRFADLGLVVIDEEQRFGVAQKERFKKLKTQLDVLTLSRNPHPAHAAHRRCWGSERSASSRRRRSTDSPYVRTSS